MKKKLQLLFTICVIQSHAQTYFNKLINMPNHQYAASILQMSDGGYFIAGQASKTGMQTLFFMRTDSNGDTLWTKEYGQSGKYYFGSPTALSATNDGNFIYTGSINDGLGNSKILLVKLTSSADTLWTKQYGQANFNAGRDSQQTSDGGYIIVGDNDTLGNGTSDIVLIKTDSIGNVEWRKWYNAGIYEVAQTVQQTTDGGFFISGSRDIGSTTSLHWVVKTDNNGNMQWNQSYGSGLNDGLSWGNTTYNNTYIVNGRKQVSGLAGQAVIRKINNAVGGLIWEKEFGGIGDDGFSTKAISLVDSTIIVAGITPNLGTGKYEALLVKYDKNGVKLWDRQYGINPTAHSYVYDFKRTSDNGFIISGQSIGVGGDVWLIKVDSVGCEVSNCNVGVEELKNEKINLNIYPNPSISHTNIEVYLSENKQGQLSIYNVMGEEIFKQHVKDQDVIIFETEKLANGIYMITLSTTEGKVEKQKLMIAK